MCNRYRDVLNCRSLKGRLCVLYSNKIMTGIKKQHSPVRKLRSSPLQVTELRVANPLDFQENVRLFVKARGKRERLITRKGNSFNNNKLSNINCSQKRKNKWLILKCAKPHSLQHKCKLKLQQDTFFSLPERKYQKV